MEPIIQVRHLTAGYGDQIILKDVSFNVRPGEICMLVGGSGCGKSTLLKNMIGLHKPMDGEVLIGSVDFTHCRPRERRQVLRRFGVMYQQGALFGSMTVQENVRLVLEEFTDMPDDARDLASRAKLNLVALADAGSKMPAELSGGMQKRAAIARALALDPEIVFLDEPSAGLDPITAADLDQLILDLAKALRITFVVVTHELQSICAVADNVIMLDKSVQGILATGKPDQLKQSDDPRIRRFFNRESSKALTTGKVKS